MSSCLSSTWCRLLVIICFCSIHHPKVFSQGYNFDEYHQIVERTSPVSPDVAQMQKYGEYPVDYSTGVPNIEIPLYEIDLDGYKLPISIRYHASGIKVSEAPTCVGTGWSLSAGGCISREIKSKEDESFRPPHSHLLLDANEFDIFLRNWRVPECLELFQGMRVWDLEVDKYSYSFPGHSGSYRYSVEDDKFYTLPYEPIVIDGNRITDESGNVFMFEREERTSSSESAMSYASWISAWHLTCIRPYNSQSSINFTYANNSIGFIQYSYSETIHLGPNQPQNGNRDYHQSSIHSTSSTPIVKLSNIEWNGNHVQFDYIHSYRFDIDFLNEIVVTDANGNTIRYIKFDYYSERPDLLRQVAIQGTITSSDSEVYKFEYNENDFNRYDGVNVVTCQEDYWGYYNGLPSNPSNQILGRFIPKAYTIHEAQYINDYIQAPDRSVDTVLCKAKTLEKIIYPTGGSTEFVFESNRTSQNTICGGLRLKEYINKDKNDTILFRRSFTYSQGTPSMQLTESLYHYKKDYGEQRDELEIFYEHDQYQSTPALPLDGVCGFPIYYKTVTEYIGTRTHHQGFTIYQYNNEDANRVFITSNSLSTAHNLINFDLNDKGTGKTKLTSKTVFDQNGNVLLSEAYQYGRHDYITRKVGTKVKLSTVISPTLADLLSYENLAHPIIGSPSIAYETATMTSDIHLLTRKTTVLDGVTTISEYQYDPLLRTLSPIAETTTCSDGSKNVTEYKYPFDGTDTVYVKMREHNLQLPVAITQYKYDNVENDSIVSKKQNIYEINTTSHKVQLGKYNWSLTDNVESRLRYKYYDNGKILGITQDNAMHTSFVWGYNWQYPIMKIEGIEPDALEDILSSNLYNYLSSLTTYGNTVLNTIDQLRHELEMRGGLVTTYQYEPLKGVTKIVDPSGVVRNFRYDGLGRLVETKNASNQTLTENEYNYAQ